MWHSERQSDGKSPVFWGSRRTNRHSLKQRLVGLSLRQSCVCKWLMLLGNGPIVALTFRLLPSIPPSPWCGSSTLGRNACAAAVFRNPGRRGNGHGGQVARRGPRIVRPRGGPACTCFDAVGRPHQAAAAPPFDSFGRRSLSPWLSSAPLGDGPYCQQGPVFLGGLDPMTSPETGRVSAARSGTLEPSHLGRRLWPQLQVRGDL